MTSQNYALLFIAIVGSLIGLLIFARAKIVMLRQEARQKAVIRALIQKAQEQNESFSIQLLDAELRQTGLESILLDAEDKKLHIEVLGHVPKVWLNNIVDAYFRVSMPEGPIYYKFRASVLVVNASKEKSHLTLSFPTELSVGQKRNFIRVKPKKDMVRVIGVWYVDPTNPVPKSTAEIGRPALHYKLGMENEPVQVENISATGMALRFFMERPDVQPVDLHNGSQLLCLVIYSPEKNEKLVTFWCTCEVINIRVQEGANPILILGVEFTNWAVLEQGKSEIHWFHSSPSKGVGPITQWVMRIDMEQRKFS